MKKSVTSFIAVMLIIIFLGVTAVTGVYIPGGWTMPFRNTATSDTSATDTSDTSLPTAAQTRRTTRQTARMRLLTPLLTRLRPIPQTRKTPV